MVADAAAVEAAAEEARALVLVITVRMAPLEEVVVAGEVTVVEVAVVEEDMVVPLLCLMVVMEEDLAVAAVEESETLIQLVIIAHGKVLNLNDLFNYLVVRFCWQGL